MTRTCSTCRHWVPSVKGRGLCYRICAQPFLETDPVLSMSTTEEQSDKAVTILTLETTGEFFCALWDGRGVRRCGARGPEGTRDVRCERWWGHDGACAGLDKEGEVVRWTVE